MARIFRVEQARICCPWHTISQSEHTVKIKERKRDGVVILEMSGKLMGGPDADAFDEILKNLIHQGSRNVIVSMEKVKWVNSTGLGILISGYTTLKKSGGELKLLKVSDRIESIFIVSKLFTVFKSFEDEAEAVQSFS
ncbi:MAG: STAS domain-containing protein [Gemmatimonadales bacterium]|nr:STAS domain-containing protein [Gemmatimonadales bacterium]